VTKNEGYKVWLQVIIYEITTTVYTQTADVSC